MSTRKRSPRYPRIGGAHREIQCFDYRIFYKVDRDKKIVYVARVAWRTRSRISNALTFAFWQNVDPSYQFFAKKGQRNGAANGTRTRDP